MQIKLFTIPINNIEDFNTELNNFLKNNKIIDVEKHLITLKNNVFWCFSVSYIDSPQFQPKQKEKIDYFNILNTQDFSIFSKIRAWRKEKSDIEKIPPYIIFTDAELAEIAKLPHINIETLKSIKGLG
ncbi:MAG: HRDC domain-containing protein [Alphaproteobacteria bacterium]|nr:HRDC domain-containing protein [Alphaproteobacteria bacterium]